MTKYNVYESITYYECDPINTWIASFLNPTDANKYTLYMIKEHAYKNENFCKSYHIHSETN